MVRIRSEFLFISTTRRKSHNDTTLLRSSFSLCANLYLLAHGMLLCYVWIHEATTLRETRWCGYKNERYLPGWLQQSRPRELARQNLSQKRLWLKDLNTVTDNLLTNRCNTTENVKVIIVYKRTIEKWNVIGYSTIYCILH